MTLGHGIDLIIISIIVTILLILYISTQSDDISFYACLLFLLISIAYLVSKTKADSFLNRSKESIWEAFDNANPIKFDISGLKRMGSLSDKISSAIIPNIDYVLSTLKTTTEEEQSSVDEETQFDSNGNVIFQEEPSLADKVKAYLQTTQPGVDPTPGIVNDYIDIMIYLHTLQGSNRDAFNNILSIVNNTSMYSNTTSEETSK
jgi:hypothetical protein